LNTSKQYCTSLAAVHAFRHSGRPLEHAFHASKTFFPSGTI
jgi:hypothetical protein